MMGLLNIFIVALAAISPFIKVVKADCTMHFKSPYPHILTHFGSKHLATETTDCQLNNDETNDLYCPKGFTVKFSNYDSLYYYKQHRLQFTCYDSRWQIVGDKETVSYMHCAENYGLEMYESVSSMPNCTSFMSLVVGRNFGDLGTLKNVAVCYDIIKQQLKYASYTAYPSKIKVIEKNQIGQLNQLGLDVEVTYTKSQFWPVSVDSISSQLKKDKNMKAQFGDETYEYASLIQDDVFAADLIDLKEMLGIVWLRALRAGNWRHLLNALQIASLNAKYDVNVGVSGTITMSMLQASNEMRSLYIELDSGNTITVPKHIWAHIRALKPNLNGTTDEFVVVAQNSPFFTCNERDGLCKSMCEEVSWLKNSLFGRLQHYPVYGLVQCCRVSDVENKLDNFPKLNVEPQFMEPPSEEAISTSETTLENDEELEQ